MGDNLIYKYLDSNLFAVTTFNSETGTLSIYIINGISGKVVYKFEENSVSQGEPIDMFLSENYFVLAFKRASAAPGQLPQQELSVTEFYQSKEEADTVKLLKDFYINKADRLMQQEFSSFSMDAPFVIQESYLLTVDVKKIALTQSLAHVSSKMLVLITSNDQLYSIENAMFTARRQTKAEAEAAADKLAMAATMLAPEKPRNDTDRIMDVKSTLFPPYDGVIPQRNTNFISYDLELTDLREVYTFPTRLESTSAVVAIGHDIFFARITAESNFDRLHEDFKAPALFATIVGLIVALYAAQVYVKSKEATEQFLIK